MRPFFAGAATAASSRTETGSVACFAWYAKQVIKSFLDEETRQLFVTGRSRRFAPVERQTVRQLGLLDFAKRFEDLQQSLHAAAHTCADEQSIRVTDNCRVCFRWQDGAVWDVKVVNDGY